MANETERLMDNVEVRKFFPDNLADIVGFPEEKVRYVGIHTKKPKEHNGVEVVSESLYLASVVSNLFLWNKDDDLDLRQSKSKWIREEGVLYDEIAERKYRDTMYGYSPLLVLRVLNRTQPTTEPFKFAELLRYADHERFRRRGLATAVLGSVCDEMASSFGTHFVYVNYGWSSWPKKSEVIPVAFSSEELRRQVMDCFPLGYHSDVFFDNFERSGFFRVTDIEANASAHEAAMQRYEANAQRIDEALAKEKMVDIKGA